MEKEISEKISKEKMLEDIMQVSSGQGELVKALGDALMHITLAGHFIQRLYINGLDYCNIDSATELRSKAATAQV